VKGPEIGQTFEIDFPMLDSGTTRTARVVWVTGPEGPDVIGLRPHSVPRQARAVRVVAVCQPLARFDNSAVVGVEALIFWRHRDSGILERDRFIELAEETGLALKLDRWLLRTACHDARRWRGMFGDAAPGVSVNISARLLRDPAPGRCHESGRRRAERAARVVG
jgi:EAL domain-containing protein (putative c-di-GMP-specific phosphodiesterase class I)